MAEQYIYSRAEKEFTNTLHQTIAGGFGFVAFSPGMSTPLKDAVKSHCEDCPRFSQTDSQGDPLPLLRKVRLPKGQVLLQKSTWSGGDFRGFHVAHGYVVEEEELKGFGPDKWFQALFRMGDPNEEKDGIILESRLEFAGGEVFRAKTLKETLDTQGINQESFCQLLLSCFDALALGRLLLVAWDFDRPDEQELRRSVLYWVYTCLPYDLWSGLGFDSIYSDRSAPGQIHLAFVDKALVHGSGKNVTVQVGGQNLALGGNFLVLDGTVIHNEIKCPTDWYGKNGVYARWLGQIVNTLWECPAEDLPSVTQALAEFRQSFQEQLVRRKEREERLNPKWYNAVLIGNLSSAPKALDEACKRVKSSVSASELYDFRLAFIDSLSEEEQQAVLMNILQDHKKKVPVSEEDVKTLCILFEHGLEAPVSGLLGAFMAEEIDKRGEVTPVLDRYQKTLPPKLYSTLPERIFFSKADRDDTDFWKDCGVDDSDPAAKRRRDTWFREKVPGNEELWRLPTSIKDALEELKGGLVDQQRAEFWQEPFRARCSAASKPGRELSDLTNDKNLRQKLDDLKKELSRLPGGKEVEDDVDELRREAYCQLLKDPVPFMNGQWLRDAVIGQKIGGDTGEMLDVLSSFINKSPGDLKSLINCCGGKPKNVQDSLLAETLPNMFLQGTLPQPDKLLVISFLMLCPEESRSKEILRQVASQGGSKLLSDILSYLEKYQLQYPTQPTGGQRRENQTVFSKVMRIIKEDSEIREKLREKEGNNAAQLYKQAGDFRQGTEAQSPDMQSPETGKAPPSPNIVANTRGNITPEKTSNKRKKKGKQGR